MTRTILDTGPLIAYLNREDRFHEWAVAQLSQLTPPLLTCEPVLAECCFLVKRSGQHPADIMTKLREGAMEIALGLKAEAAAIEVLMRRYGDTPMSLADACLVRVSELQKDSRVCTLDRHFNHYRRYGRQVIPLLAPWCRT